MCTCVLLSPLGLLRFGGWVSGFRIKMSLLDSETRQSQMKLFNLDNAPESNVLREGRLLLSA